MSIPKAVKVVISKLAKDAVSEWGSREWYQEILKTGDTARVATSSQLGELRVGVRLGEIEPFSFTYEDNEFNVGENGALEPYWPCGFMDNQAKQIYVLISGMTRDQANEKNISKHKYIQERLLKNKQKGEANDRSKH
jgi:hypothetical protein